MSRGPSRYLEHVREVPRKCYRGHSKESFISKNEVLSEYSEKTSLSEVKLFFQRHLENFLCTVILCSRYLEGPPNIVFCVSKKSGSYDTSIRLYVRKSDKNLNFEKTKLKMRLEYSDKTSLFEVKFFFFSKASRKFSVHFHTMFKVSGRSS